MSEVIVTVTLLKKIAGYNINPGEDAGFSQKVADELVKAGLATYKETVEIPAPDIENLDSIPVEVKAKKKKGRW
ncbi:MAG: hypothetical protein AB2L14_25330 [Candidatus Xenobiia bacterium LiM19]